MFSKDRSLSSHPPPDLDEFFSTLGGVINKDQPLTDLNHIKFLSIFCRTIGAKDGHLLRLSDTNTLKSIISIGLPKKFDKEFNNLSVDAETQPSPLHAAFTQKEVMAIVDVSKETQIPKWYRKILDGHDVQSLVAVPLIGDNGPSGILCAYYHDVCLFDHGTVSHLATIGRMLGAALERETVPVSTKEGADSAGHPDEFLRQLTAGPFSKSQLFPLAVRHIQKFLEAKGIVVGTLKKNSNGMIFSILAGAGVNAEFHAKNFSLPLFLKEDFLNKSSQKNLRVLRKDDWGPFFPLVSAPMSSGMGKPLIWENKLLGGIVVWRSSHSPFTPQDEKVLERIAGIVSVAMQI